MATFATTGYTSMIKHAGGETTGDVAHGTILCGGNMVHRLADGRRAIVAGGAVIHDTGVIEHGR